MVNQENYEEYMLLYVDGELNEQEKQALLHYVNQHPELQTELDAYMATVLVPNDAIVYEDKAALMQPVTKGRTIFFGGWKTYAAAASVAALIAFVFFSRTDDVNNNATTVATTNQNTKVETPSTNNQLKKTDNKLENTNSINPIAKAQTDKKQGTKQQAKNSSAPVNTIAKKTEHNPQTSKQTGNTTKRYQSTVVALETTTIKQIAGNISPETATISPNNVNKQTTNKVAIVATPKHKSTELVPIISDNIALFNTMEQAVVQKIDKAKQVAQDLKGSDLVLRVGKKEILIVKL